VSRRAGYWYKADDAVGGPFKSITETKEAASEKNASDISIRTVVELEKFTGGAWHTVH
jgi:hypothetical protein